MKRDTNGNHVKVMKVLSRFDISVTEKAIAVSIYFYLFCVPLSPICMIYIT